MGNMLKRFLIGFLSVLLVLQPFLSTSEAIAAEWNTEVIETIYNEEETLIAPGLTQTTLHASSHRGEQRMSMLTVDLNEEHLSIESGIAHNSYPGLQPLTKQAQLVSTEGHQVVAAVNADFFNTSIGTVSGLFIHKGQLLNTSTRPAFGMTADGSPVIGVPQMNHFVKAADQSFDVTSINTTRGTNNLIVFTPEYGESTSTNPYGAEVILENVEGNVHQPGTVTATVKEVISGVGNAPLEEGTIVLSGHGTANSFLKNNFTKGEQVEITLSLTEPWNEVVEAVGGNPILVESGNLANLASDAFNNAVAPRTAVGIKADGSLFFLVIDGRQPGYSEGVTIHELAEIMLDLGAVEAINLDGGGSSTLAARQPGDATLSVVNSPSDGSERSIANSLFIVSSAPTGTLTSLSVSPQKALLLANSHMNFEASGLDAAHNPVKLAEPVSWSVDGAGSISTDGTFTAGSSASTGTVTATSGDAVGSTTVEVVDEIDDIQLPQAELTLDRGGEFNLAAKAFKNKREVILDQDQLQWEVEGDVGEIDENGYFIATDKSAIGTVTVSYGNVEDTIEIEVGKMPIILEDFENGIDHWTKSGARYNTIDIRQTTYPEPARFGDHALQIDYDFVGTQGTSGAYAYPKEDIVIEGYPESIGMWVYGDGKGHWLRAQLKDGDGNAFPIDFAAKVDWVGWKYVDAPIPTGKSTPLKIDLAVRYMETSNANKNAGTIYVDNIRAVYGETNDDLTNPTLSDIYPAAGEELTDNVLEISAIATDDIEGTGINPDRIEMTIDGQAVTPSYDEATGEISYVPEHPFADGIHIVDLKVQDNFGNPVEKTWNFTVNTGSASLTMETPEKVYAGNQLDITISANEMQDMYGSRVVFSYDPSKMTIVDQEVDVEGIQIGVSEKVKQATIITNEVNEEQGEIIFEVKDLDRISEIDEEEALLTITANVKSDAVDDVRLDWVEGAIWLNSNKELALPMNLPDFETEISYGLQVDVGVLAINKTAEIKVTDENGEPVSGAGVFVRGDINQVAMIKSAVANLYREKDTQSEVVATGNEFERFLLVEQADDWLKVKQRNGNIGWIEAKDATVSLWGQPLGTTNNDGVLRTNLLTLATGDYQLQAKKGTDYSVNTTKTVKPLLGTTTPEQLVLTWEHSPKTTQSFTWRTSPDVVDSVVQIVERDQFTSFDADNVVELEGTSFLHETDLGVKQMHEVDAMDLTPGTAYVYRVGDGTDAGWSEEGTFTTEPEEDEAFSFIFTSDTQSIANGSDVNGYGIWGEIFGKSLQEYPDAKFMLLSGDIVDYGDQQIHWEHWFDAAKDYLPNVNMVPVLGNHDVIGTGNDNFKAQFQLPRNGPEGEVEQAYSFDYGNMHLAVLNTEGDLQKQAEWLIEDMKNSDKDWKIVSFHRSPYHSHESRGSDDVRKAWTWAFDEVGIDLVLSGHDHAYMRSWPLYNDEIVGEGEGTTYIIGGSAGPKFYQMGDQEWIRVGFDDNIQIYSGVTIDGNELSFKVTTRDGDTVDAFTMVKPEEPEEPGEEPGNPGEDPNPGEDEDTGEEPREDSSNDDDTNSDDESDSEDNENAEDEQSKEESEDGFGPDKDSNNGSESEETSSQISNDVTDKEKDATSKEGKELPNTATNMYRYLAIGIGLLMIGIAMIIVRRKRMIN